MVMDGDLVVLDAHGRSDFETLRRRSALRRPTSVEYAAKRIPAAIFAFDLLELRDKDLRTLPLLSRKQLLREHCGAPSAFGPDHVGGSGHRLWLRRNRRQPWGRTLPPWAREWLDKDQDESGSSYR